MAENGGFQEKIATPLLFVVHNFEKPVVFCALDLLFAKSQTQGDLRKPPLLEHS